MDPDSQQHRQWLQQQTEELLGFGRRTPYPGGGAAWLDDTGAPQLDRGVHTWITARTLHVYALATLLGRPGSAEIARTALDGLTGRLRDGEHGGWFPSVSADGRPAPGKACYDHAFVLLAAGSGVTAGLAGAAELLAEAAVVFERRFVDHEAGRCVDTWDTAFSVLDPYRGMNANMHAVEAMLAAADVTGDTAWQRRAASIAGFLARVAADHDWRIPEHFDESWTPQLDYNGNRRADPFKPYGATVGHGFEWSRLLLNLEAALDTSPVAGSDWLGVSRSLFERAVADGWSVDGAPGFVYTTDWEGNPVVRDRMHWVAAEAVAAAASLWRRTGEDRYADLYGRWWDYIGTAHRDATAGSWHHQLDADNRPIATVWPGKPDLYHAVQATLIPRLPLAPTLATALRGGRLDAVSS